MVTPSPPISFMRKNEVKARCGFKSDSSLYDAIAKGRFVKPLKLSDAGRSVAWRSDLIENWIAERIQAAKEA